MKGLKHEELPVNVGEEMKVFISAVGEKGHGIARVEGYVIFVEGAEKGEKCQIKITKTFSKYGFAERID